MSQSSPTTFEEESAPTSDEASESVGRSRRLGRLSLTGSILGTLAAWASVQPSLVPRAWLIQGLLTGLCIITAYAVGAFVGWGYRTLQLPTLPAPARTLCWRVLAVAAPLGLAVAAWLGRGWQSEQRVLLGMDTSISLVWLLGPFLGILVAALMLAVGRGVRWVGIKLSSLLGRILPGRLAMTLAVALTAFATWSVVSGLLTDVAATAANQVFEVRNGDNKPGVFNPESPYRSAGPTSGITWEDLGREGRQFIWQGRTAEQITEVTGDAGAVEPVRVFVGLDTADTPEERAQIAIDELQRLGGFDRRAIAVAGGTGSGWIDPQAGTALEFVAHGDVATVTMQYSYLPSWLSFLIDKEKAASNAEELITAVRVALDQLPPDERPELYTFGESLGAFSTGSAFTSVEDMSTTTDGALLIGPPSFDTTWQGLQEERDPGSPLWQPRFQDGALVRVAATDDDITDPSLVWQTDNRIIYLVHASDPIVAWTADRSEWIDPRGPDVSPYVTSIPVVSGWAATLDQFAANGTPPGHGHVYDETVVTAWSEIFGPPSLPDAEIEAIKDAVAEISDP